MTKAELIDRIARSRKLSTDVTKKCVGEILDVAFAELSTYFVKTKVTRTLTPRFTFPGFGTFTKKRRNPRRGVHPQTLQPIEIGGYETLDFKPGRELKASLNQKGKRTANRARAAKPGASAKSLIAGTRQKKRIIEVLEDRNSTPVSGPTLSPDAASMSPSGRKLLTREEVEMEISLDEKLRLPATPLQRVAVKNRRVRAIKSG